MQRLKHLVIVIPGIGGSHLVAPAGLAQWDTAGGALAQTLIRPALLDLDRTGQMEPVGLVRSFTTLAPLLSITGYEGLVAHLQKNFRDVIVHTHRDGRPIPPATDVLLFPYDFRRSVVEAAERLDVAVTEALGPLSDASRRDRVLIVAHSMGGLVARYWIGAHGGWRTCRALFTLGTPHRGAPKALEWLLAGAGVGRLRHPGVTRALRSWPSMYELLPQYPAVWDEKTSVPLELATLPPRWASASIKRVAFSGTYDAAAARGRHVHDEIARSWNEIPAARVPEVATFFGRGHATTGMATLTLNGRLTFSKLDPPWRGNVGWGGDGTVPMLSAIPPELGEARVGWRGLPERHGELAGTGGFIDLLTSYAGDALPTRGGEFPDRPWFGLDLEEVVCAGSAISIGVQVMPETSTAVSILLTLTSDEDPLTPPFQIALTRHAERWTVLLPGLPAGIYHLGLEGRLEGSPDPVFARTRLVALDPDKEAEIIDNDVSGYAGLDEFAP